MRPHGRRRPAPSRAFSLLFVAAIATLPLAAAQPLVGDWIITGTETLEGRTLLLTGNLIVRDKGTLTIRDSTILVNGRSHLQFSILVEPGGQLHIQKSRLAPTGLGMAFGFGVHGQSFTLIDSELEGLGWCDRTAQVCDQGGFQWDWSRAHERGLFVATRGARIENNRFTDNTIAVFGRTSDSIIRGNTIEYGAQRGEMAIWVIGDRNLIENNIIRHSVPNESSVLFVEGSHNAIVGNDIWAAEPPPYPGSTEEPGVKTIGVFNGEGNRVVDNRVNRSSLPLWLYAVSDTLIEGNDVVFMEVGALIRGAPGTRLVGNRFEGRSMLSGGLWHNDGMILHNVPSSLIANNVVTGKDFKEDGSPRMGQHLYVGHTTGAIVANNRFDAPASVGINLFQSHGNQILDNQEAKSVTGLIVLGSDENVFSGNDVRPTTTLSLWTGATQRPQAVVVDSSRGNRLSLNNFIAPVEPFDSGGNVWADGGRGNFWTGSNAPDGNRDGVRDSAYAIGPGGVDPHPLAKPIEWKPVPRKAPLVVPAGPVAVGNRIDAIVTNRQTISGAALAADGGQYQIQAGGSLVIQDSHVRLGLERGFDIHVHAGGRLELRNTILDWHRGALQVESGGIVVFENSRLNLGLWWPTMLSLRGHAEARIVSSEMSSPSGGAGFVLWHQGPWPQEAPPSAGPKAGGSLHIKDSLLEGGHSWWMMNPSVSVLRVAELRLENTTVASSIGVNVGQVKKVVFDHVDLRTNAFGVLIEDTVDLRFSDVRIDTVGYEGAVFFRGTQSCLVERLVVERSWGGGVRFDGPCTMRDSRIENVPLYYGLAAKSFPATIEGNTFLHTAGLMVEHDASVVYRNNIIGPAENPVIATGATTSWYKDGEGNHWSAYKVQDKDGDGIGDDWYTIDSWRGIYDRFPFVDAFGWLPPDARPSLGPPPPAMVPKGVGSVSADEPEAGATTNSTTSAAVVPVNADRRTSAPMLAGVAAALWVAAAAWRRRNE